MSLQEEVEVNYLQAVEEDCSVLVEPFLPAEGVNFLQELLGASAYHLEGQAVLAFKKAEPEEPEENQLTTAALGALVIHLQELEGALPIHLVLGVGVMFQKKGASAVGQYFNLEGPAV